ncbi:hypothetical protein M199_gp117 [Halogranum tailed virus 1]|uniref:Uncharacterized protein n=1 Tax=Halogranum tailed virus 1 TaxID=1273749 RepID=R4T740_9CAUD|nr:hypothetical protein M199_gp117 [Halogranum tailed virus 1]AGM11549.1 hypothetical protein HGTV1_252 [Halogranum tailed virus 1]
MTQVTIAVPTFTGVHEQFTVEVDTTYPDGTDLPDEVTALVGGRPDNWNDEILGFIVGGGGSSARSADEMPYLADDIRAKLAIRSITG